MTKPSSSAFSRPPIYDKDTRLAAQIAALNVTGEAEETFTLDPADLAMLFKGGERTRHTTMMSISCWTGKTTQND